MGGHDSTLVAMDPAPPVAHGPAWWEKTLAVIGASLLFSGFDYVGYNATRQNPTALKVYRVSQVLAQLGITYLLYESVGPGPALGFNLVWWTFGCDFIYYGYAEVVNPGHPWESRGDYSHGVGADQCTWAYWTPLGIARGMKRGEKIPERTLLAQSLIGAALGIGITVVW